MTALRLSDLPPAVQAKALRAGEALEPGDSRAARDLAKASRALKRAQREADYRQRVATLTAFLAAEGVQPPILEWEFARGDGSGPGWRFDLAWPEHRLALEVDGGAFMPGGGRHGRGAGMVEDMAKRNSALLLGWRVVHVLPERLGRSETADLVARALRVCRGGVGAVTGELPTYILAARRAKGTRRRKVAGAVHR